MTSYRVYLRSDILAACCIVIGTSPKYHSREIPLKLLYIGTHFCPVDTLARLLVLGDELVFLDRPSVTFGNWGTVGSSSYIRGISFGESPPVKVSVAEPPSGPARGLYESYVQADIANPAFIRAFLDGLKGDDIFAERFLPRNANYGGGRNGEDVRRLLAADQSLYDATLDLAQGDPSLMYKPETAEGRKAVAKTLIVDASIQVTSALLMADDLEALPIADDVTYPRLLALRASSSNYIGGTHFLAPRLGLEFARTIIPDEALKKLDFQGIFEYRRKSKGVYDAWNIELNKIAAKLSESDLESPDETIRNLVATELMPKVKEYESELESIRDKLFGDLIKGIATWEFPTISIAYFANLGFAGAVAAFAAAVKGTVPQVVDYVTSRRAVTRRHAMSYLIGLSKR